MSDSLSEEPVALQLSRKEALVLYELLARFEETNQLKLTRNAEFLAISALFGALQATLTEPLNPDYKAMLEQASVHLESGFDGVAPGVNA